VAKNALKTYPTNKYQEELSWIVLQAKYQQTINSVDAKKQERAIDANDEYYSFVTQYPESKHLSAAKKIHKEIEAILEN
jgi:outer membrane protein assembly factor BamD